MPRPRAPLDDGAVHFVAYAAMDGLICTGEKLVEDVDGITQGLLEKIDYPVDGLVAEVTDPDLRSAMGRTAHHYRWQIAIKTRGETAETRVIAVTWQVGRTGNVTPVMEVTPVSLSGATIRRVTAHNAGMIERLGIGPGAGIEIIRSGEVIPKLERVLSLAETVELPRTCPSCGTVLVRQNDFLRCPNTDGCRDQSVQRIRYWFHTLGNADWFGLKTVERLVDAGHRSLEKIYRLTPGDYESLGFGPVQSKNLAEAARLSRTETVEDWRFLAAFGIPDLGLGDSRNLLRVFPLEMLLGVDAGHIARIRGFGRLTSTSIAGGLALARETIRHMLGLDFSLRRTRPADGGLYDRPGPFRGRRTTRRHHPKGQAAEERAPGPDGGRPNRLGRTGPPAMRWPFSRPAAETGLSAPWSCHRSGNLPKAFRRPPPSAWNGFVRIPGRGAVGRLPWRAFGSYLPERWRPDPGKR